MEFRRNCGKKQQNKETLGVKRFTEPKEHPSVKNFKVRVITTKNAFRFFHLKVCVLGIQ